MIFIASNKQKRQKKKAHKKPTPGRMLNCALILQTLKSTLRKPFTWILTLQEITLPLCNGRLPCLTLKMW